MLVSAVWETGKLDTIGVPEALRARGHHVEVMSANNLKVVDAVKAGQPHDVVLCRFANQPRAIEASCRLARAGLPVVGGGRGVEVGRDQVLTLRALARAGLPSPEWAVVTSLPEIAPAATRLGWPVVTKAPYTVGGVGVRLAQDARAIAEHLENVRDDTRLVVQRFHAEAAGEDLRLFVVGDEVVGAVRRVAADGDFRANLWLGGTTQPFYPETDASRLAIAAARAVGLDIAGVDLLATSEGLLVVEVNPKPGVTGITSAVDAIVGLVERRAAA